MGKLVYTNETNQCNKIPFMILRRINTMLKLSIFNPSVLYAA